MQPRTLAPFLLSYAASFGCQRDRSPTAPPAAPAPTATPDAAPRAPAAPPDAASEEESAARRAASASALRARIRDASLAPQQRAAARLELVTLWLEYERQQAAHSPPDCQPQLPSAPAAPDAGSGRPRDREGPMPSLPERAQLAARSELRCAEHEGVDVSEERSRLVQHVRSESERCIARGQRSWQGNVFSMLGAGDACSAAFTALDQRLGVTPPPDPGNAFGASALRGIEAFPRLSDAGR